MKKWTKLFIACVLAVLMALSPGLTGILQASGMEEGTNIIHILSADNFPTEIPEGMVYVLDNDITLGEDVQIASLAGTLDGKGHKITLVNKPLADTVSGTIQNLGVDSTETLSSASFVGSMAVTLTGTIKNCYSMATVFGSGWNGLAGGFAGKAEGNALVTNSYFAGSISDDFFGFNSGGIVGCCNSKDAAVNYSCAPVGSACAYGSACSDFNKGSYAQKTLDEIKTCADLLNSDIQETGYYWSTSQDGENSGFPVLKEGKIPVGDVDQTALENLIDSVEGKKEEDYTDASWSKFATVLDKAKKLLDSENLTQKAINDMVDELAQAVSGLEKKRPTIPVRAPEEEDKIIHISSQEDLKKIDYNKTDVYYVLDNDISLNNKYMPLGDFNATLDGKGHKITFENSMTGVFSNLGKNGVLQNIYFTGNIDAFQATGPAGGTVNGSVINCYSDVTGEGFVYGLAGALNNGVISNCYSISTAKGGVLMKSLSGGILYHTYWQEGLTQNATITESSLVESGSKKEEELKSKEFVSLLNQNKGDYGISWGQSSIGYPYFGKDQEYKPDVPEILPENQYRIYFTPYNAEEPVEINDQKLDLSPDEVDPNGRIAGTVSIPDLTKGSTLSWNKKEGSSDQIAVYDSGELCVYGDGTAIITAVETTKEGDRKEVATFAVSATSRKMEDLKLFVGDEEINSTYKVQGSEWTKITAKVRYEGSDQYVKVSSIRFNYTTDNEDLIYCTGSSSEFYFKKPGTASVTVTSKSDSELKKTATFESEYVPVTSIKPAIGGKHAIHGRNANSTKSRDFIPNYSGVIVEPENASNRNQFTILSSNPEVGRYVADMVLGYVPYKAGTTTYTATIKDTAPNGTVNEVSGSSTVTYEYTNPLSEITVDKDNISVKNNSETILPISMKGTRSGEGYSITEPELTWTYDKEGIVKIERKGNGAFKREETAPDNNQFFPSADYYIYAQQEGTVIATGTPVDTTNGVKPVKVKITVTAGEEKMPDVDELAKQGVDGASEFLMKQQEGNYVYGDEWIIFATLRAGKTIPNNQKEAYYKSVVDEIKTWKITQKPTDIERTALALDILGKDITNIEGINLVEMIVNHPKLSSGSNELAYALLALDARDVEIPENAKWNREKIINALLNFQNRNDGGFGLYGNNDSGIDTTAMALQALAPYEGENSKAKEAIEKGLDYLKKNLSAEYDAGTAEATAQVLIAVTVLNRDLLNAASGFGTAYKNLVTSLSSYKVGGSTGFSHVKDGAENSMASIQALEAMTSFQRFRTKKSSYWDLSDVTVETPVQPEKPVTPQKPVAPQTPVISEKALSRVSGLKAVTVGTDSIKLSWKKVKGASGYIVYRYDRKQKKYKEIKQVRTNSLKDKKLSSGKKYRYYICAYKLNGNILLKGKASAVVTCVTRPVTPKITSVKKISSKKAQINLKSGKNVKGYRLYAYSAHAKKYVLIARIEGKKYYQYNAEKKKFILDKKSKASIEKRGDTVNVKITTVNVNLNQYRKYRYKVRAYVTYNGKKIFSQYSNVKKLLR